MNTLLTKAAQQSFLKQNRNLTTLQLKWTCRGNGSVALLDRNDGRLHRVGGTGYDRAGTCLAEFLMVHFQPELDKLAKRFRVKDNTRRVQSMKDHAFYGLYWKREAKTAYVDGACGFECMRRILNVIGFEINCIKESNGRAQSGVDIYELAPVSAHNKKYMIAPIK